MTHHERLQELCKQKKFVAIFTDGRIRLVPVATVETYDDVCEAITALEKK